MVAGRAATVAMLRGGDPRLPLSAEGDDGSGATESLHAYTHSHTRIRLAASQGKQEVIQGKNGDNTARTLSTRERDENMRTRTNSIARATQETSC
jgi:hypothetical protein